MNIGILTRSNAIFTYTGLWLISSLIVSAYFSFTLFPNLLNSQYPITADIYFQTKSKNGSVVYYPNISTYRDNQLSKISDKNFVYISTCDALPVSQKPNCLRSSNWKKIDFGSIGCTDISSCEVSSYILTKVKRENFYSNIKTKPGTSISIEPPEKLSFSNPASWGPAATWPIFFISIFMSIKLGRALGEFVFLPYEK